MEPVGNSLLQSNCLPFCRSVMDCSEVKCMKESLSRCSLESSILPSVISSGVAPGPVWTPLITATFPEKKVASFGEETPLGRAGHPSEIAPAYVFLASADSSYITGQVIHPNGE
jgi:NAD(P)-dependent dehydrogenase (short-subunit alcohol dehydrogenase family)